ncbi:D-alanine--D-alanine ligase family protein [Streptomyces flavidovirens]
MTVTTMPDIETLRIGVLCGGNSPERAGSIASGEHAAKALAGAGLTTELIDIADTPLSALAGRIDVALLGLHGLGGEDGKVQGALEMAGMPYTGSGVLASALGMHKPTFKQLLARVSIDTPRWVVPLATYSVAATLSAVRHTLGYPVFIKPASGGGSLAAGIARDDHQLRAMLETTQSEPYAEYVIEEYVQGIPCTVGMIEVEGHMVTLPVHDVESKKEFYDYEAKHDPNLRVEHCPSILPPPTTEGMQYLAKRVFQMIGAHGVIRVDFMVAASGRSPCSNATPCPDCRSGGTSPPWRRRAASRTPF